MRKPTAVIRERPAKICCMEFEQNGSNLKHPNFEGARESSFPEVPIDETDRSWGMRKRRQPRKQSKNLLPLIDLVNPLPQFVIPGPIPNLEELILLSFPGNFFADVPDY